MRVTQRTRACPSQDCLSFPPEVLASESALAEDSIPRQEQKATSEYLAGVFDDWALFYKHSVT